MCYNSFVNKELTTERHDVEQHTLFIIGTNGEERQSLIDFFK